MAKAFFTPPPPPPSRRPLTQEDAVNIWIARWLKVRQKDLVRRYACDPRRLYEIWEETRFAGSRAKALEVFRARYPGLANRIDPGSHQRISKAPHPGSDEPVLGLPMPTSAAPSQRRNNERRGEQPRELDKNIFRTRPGQRPMIRGMFFLCSRRP